MRHNPRRDAKPPTHPHLLGGIAAAVLAAVGAVSSEELVGQQIADPWLARLTGAAIGGAVGFLLGELVTRAPPAIARQYLYWRARWSQWRNRPTPSELHLREMQERYAEANRPFMPLINLNFSWGPTLQLAENASGQFAGNPQTLLAALEHGLREWPVPGERFTPPESTSVPEIAAAARAWYKGRMDAVQAATLAAQEAVKDAEARAVPRRKKR